MAEGIGERFQRETKYIRSSIRANAPDWSKKPPLYKTYPDAERFSLPDPKQVETLSTAEALAKRRSIRHFTHHDLGLVQLSFLLWAANGIQRVERGHEFRTAPSAGALYPIETYLTVDRVSGLPPGIYHYDVRQHGLEQLRTGQFGHEVTMATGGQKMCLEAPVTFMWTAIFERSKWKYDERAYRYIYLDAGHIAENLALAATSIGLGTCQIGALFDDEVNAIIGVDGASESIIYMSVVGHPAGM